MASSRKEYNSRGAGAFASEDSPVLCGAWFTKKAPTKLAKSKRRWFEMNKDEIRYFAKMDSNGKGDPETQKGAVGLFNATRARAVHETLFITNPDREWVLTGANTLKGQQQATAWAERINDIALGGQDQGTPTVNISPQDALSEEFTDAAAGGNAAKIKELLGQGGDKDSRERSGETALHRAAFYNHIKVVELLLEANANTELEESETGTTPLVVAAGKGFKDVVAALLEAGASTTHTTKEGLTAHATATATGKVADLGPDIIGKLEMSGFDIDFDDDDFGDDLDGEGGAAGGGDDDGANDELNGFDM